MGMDGCPAPLGKGWGTGAGARHVGGNRGSPGDLSLGSVGGSRKFWEGSGRADTYATLALALASRYGCCLLPCHLYPSRCAPTMS